MSAITILTLLITLSVFFYSVESSSSSNNWMRRMNPLKVGGSSSRSQRSSGTQPGTPRPFSMRAATPLPSNASMSSSLSLMAVIGEEEEEPVEQITEQQRIIMAERLTQIKKLEYSVEGDDIVAHNYLFGRLVNSRITPIIHKWIQFVKFDYPAIENAKYISKTAWLVGVYTWLLSANTCHIIPLMLTASEEVEKIEKRRDARDIQPSQLTDQDEREEKELEEVRERLCDLHNEKCDEEAYRARLFREHCLQEEYEENDQLKMESRKQLRERRQRQRQRQQKLLQQQQQLEYEGMQHQLTHPHQHELTQPQLQQQQLHLLEQQMREINLGGQQQYHQPRHSLTGHQTDGRRNQSEREERRRLKQLQKLHEEQQDPEKFNQMYHMLNPSIIPGYPRDPNNHHYYESNK